MPQTVIRGTQILNNTVQRQDLDTGTVGQAVITKLVQGTNVTLSSTGADSGTGDVTISAPVATATTAGAVPTPPNNTTTHLRGDATFSDFATDLQPVIWSVRLRSFNAIGNPNFGVTQRNIGTSLTNPNGFIEDRWAGSKAGTMTYTAQVINAGFTGIVLPGTNFTIAKNYLRVTLTGQEASLAAGDYLQLFTTVEGPRLLELVNDVHSLSLLVRSSVAGLSFGAALTDSGPVTRSLTKLCTIPSANTWTLIPLSNLPVFPSAGNFTTVPGGLGYYPEITLAAGSTYMSPANNTWQNGNFFGALGQSNFAAQAVNSTLDIAFIQHEPGALCTTPIDCPFTQNYDDCLRYFQKSYDYAVKYGTNTGTGNKSFSTGAANTTWALGTLNFAKPMAKDPTVVILANDGTANAASIFGGANVAISGVLSVGQTGFSGITFSSAQTANTGFQFHYTADTGW